MFQRTIHSLAPLFVVSLFYMTQLYNKDERETGEIDLKVNLSSLTATVERGER